MLLKYLSPLIHFKRSENEFEIMKKTFYKAKKIYSFVSGAPGDEKKSQPGSRKNIFLGKIC